MSDSCLFQRPPQWDIGQRPAHEPRIRRAKNTGHFGGLDTVRNQPVSIDFDGFRVDFLTFLALRSRFLARYGAWRGLERLLGSGFWAPKSRFRGFRTVESKPGLMALAPPRPEVASLCQQSMTFPQHQDKALKQSSFWPRFE